MLNMRFPILFINNAITYIYLIIKIGFDNKGYLKKTHDPLHKLSKFDLKIAVLVTHIAIAPFHIYNPSFFD